MSSHPFMNINIKSQQVSTPPQAYSSLEYRPQSMYHTGGIPNGRAEAEIEADRIYKIYEQRKQQYISRVRSLADHVELNYPDKGKYIGQIINKNSRHGQGIYFYPTGDVYFGGWKLEMFHGQGVYMFASGEIYDGLLKDSAKDGRGTYYYDRAQAYYSGTWENDMKVGSGLLNSPEEYYEGEWSNGMKHGNGHYKNKVSGSVYVGEWFNGTKSGKGTIVYGDGSVFAGQIRNEQPHGIGDFQYVNKDKYIGQFIEGKKHGKGNYFFSEGTVFCGTWQNDSKIQGELTLFNGDHFKGVFQNNQRYQGVYKYRNGDVYEGTWKDDFKEGYGKLFLENGQQYDGQFVNGHKHGSGVYSWKNGDRYEGTFTFDKRQGLGMYFWNQGGQYKGEWKADRMNGYGRLVKDGIDVIGQFFEDHFQKSIQQHELGSLRNYILSSN